MVDDLQGLGFLLASCGKGLPKTFIPLASRIGVLNTQRRDALIPLLQEMFHHGARRSDVVDSDMAKFGRCSMFPQHHHRALGRSLNGRRDRAQQHPVSDVSQRTPHHTQFDVRIAPGGLHQHNQMLTSRCPDHRFSQLGEVRFGQVWYHQSNEPSATRSKTPGNIVHLITQRVQRPLD